MGLDYDFYGIDKKFKFGMEGYAFNQAKVFCKVMGLPEIPTTSAYCTRKGKKHTTNYFSLKQFAHWNIWGMEKLMKITVEDTSGKFFEAYRHCYETEEALEENRQNILLLIREYSIASYYEINV